MQRNPLNDTSYFPALNANNKEQAPAKLESYDLISAKHGKKDYIFSNEELECAGAEYKGYRKTQEDRVDFSHVPGFEYLSPEHQNQLIIDTIYEIQSNIINASVTSPYAGSCLIMNILLPGKNPEQHEVITVSLGDSVSHIAVHDKKSGDFKVNLVNKFHKPTEEDEIKRLSDIPNAIVNRRLGGTLAVSGAIGDLELMKYGLTQTPKIYRSQINKTDSDQNVYIITACDGLIVNIADIEKLLKITLGSNATLSDTAKCLAENSIDLGDNVSVILTKANNRKNPLSAPFAICVFDGHGGNDIADLLQHVFLNTLNANVQLELRKTSTAQNTLPAYLSEVESAMNHSDNMIEFLLHMKQAERIKKQMLADMYGADSTATQTFFAPAKLETNELQKQVNQLQGSIEYAYELYLDRLREFSRHMLPNFDTLKERVLKQCKEMAASSARENKDEMECSSPKL